MKISTICGRKIEGQLEKEREAEKANSSLKVGRTFLREYCLDFSENSQPETTGTGRNRRS